MPPILKLDIVIPTYNRAALLEKTLASIRNATMPANLELGIIVVDNNSTDATQETVQRLAAEHGGRLRYALEKRQGRSFALNAGIALSTADVIGMIDDDEEIEKGWVCEIARRFADEDLDFLGGPCVPNWGPLTCPNWLPRSHGGLIGWIVPSECEFAYGEGTDAYMVGGNSVVRRRVFEKVGAYHTGLGRTSTKINGGEDLEFFTRLMAAGAKGRYSPALIIFHYIPRERLDQGFFRSRSFWDGVSIGFVSRTRRQPVPHVAGIPRHFIRTVAEGILRRISFAAQPASERFADTLRLYELIGRAYGRYLYQGG